MSNPGAPIHAWAPWPSGWVGRFAAASGLSVAAPRRTSGCGRERQHCPAESTGSLPDADECDVHRCRRGLRPKCAQVRHRYPYDRRGLRGVRLGNIRSFVLDKGLHPAQVLVQGCDASTSPTPGEQAQEPVWCKVLCGRQCRRDKAKRPYCQLNFHRRTVSRCLGQHLGAIDVSGLAGVGTWAYLGSDLIP
jgi:hypothetical protein